MEAAWLTGVSKGLLAVSGAVDFTAAETFASALISCAEALEPIASMNSPTTADAPRPPRIFTTDEFALCWRVIPLEPLIKSFCLQRGIPRLALPGFNLPGSPLSFAAPEIG